MNNNFDVLVDLIEELTRPADITTEERDYRYRLVRKAHEAIRGEN